MSKDHKTRSDVEDVVRRYYRTVADLDSPTETLAELLAKKVTIVEHPNPITPHGASRGREETLTGFAAGKDLLSAQSFEVHEVLVQGERAAVRATWRGTIGADAGPLRAGTELHAMVASFLTVVDGKITEQETFDCYQPF